MKFKITFFLFFIYLFGFTQEHTTLKTYSAKELYSDFDFMVNALKEAHAGLYWYQSVATFDSLCAQERAEIKDGMHSYDFFRIVSKIVTATKEGHCRIGSSKNIGKYFNEKALIPPIIVKVLDKKVYILNDIEHYNTKGKILTKINNTSIDSIIKVLFSYSPRCSDGFIKTGKLRYTIDYSGLAYYYTDYFANTSTYTLELLNTKTHQTETIKVKGLSSGAFRVIESSIAYPDFQQPIELKIDTNKKIAQLSIHSFRHTYYDKDGNEDKAFNIFTGKIDSVFEAIRSHNITDLIIDVRQNGGGTEGYEDYVFSYLTDKNYVKYKYVQANSLSFSFLNHTQHKTPEAQQAFEEDMQNEFRLEKDGRYLRRADFMKVEPPKDIPFKGNIYVLISGKTYSGGAEFAGLLKAKTNAIFIGEETGGGFYGQTSGFGLTLTLPNTKISIRIPLLKFVTNFYSDDIPFGRGIIPDYKVQQTYKEFVKREDTAMQLVLQLIEKNKTITR